MGQFDKWVIVLFSIHSLYFWLSICVLGMGLTGETYKRKMVQSNLKFGLNRSISWWTEVIYSPNKKAVLDALTISLDFRTCGEYILTEYYDHLFFPTLKPVAESIPTSRQGGSSPISAGSPWPLTAIGPEHTQVQERASFFVFIGLSLHSGGLHRPSSWVSSDALTHQMFAEFLLCTQLWASGRDQRWET